MQKQWVQISDIPVQGRVFYFESIQEWTALLSDHRLEFEPAGELRAELTVLPQKQGVLLKGFIRGRVSAPCSRCLESGIIQINESFDLFEDFDDYLRGNTDTGILKYENGLWMINIRQVILEQFVLATPDKVLCHEECQGICPVCGSNMNNTACQCAPASGDPRMAVLRQLKINNK